MKKRKMLAALLCGAMLLTMVPGAAFAETGGTTTKSTDGTEATAFADMPADWSTAALQKAVTNGLISGYDVNGKKLIKPDATLTRAEMGTIINNAFGATKEASMSGVTDVASNAWYRSQMAKAVQMGSFAADKQLRPEAAITRQEVATALAKIFKLGEAKATALDSFSDKGQVASWSKSFVSSMVEQGYMTGNNGKLNPAGNITRAEFAAMMDNMVAQYIKSAGTYTTVAAKGNVLVSAKDVILKDVTINGNLILGDGVGDGNVTLDNVKVTGNTIVRGGGVNSIIIKGNSNLGTVIIAKVDGNVRVSIEGNGSVNTIFVDDGKDDVIIEGTVDKLVLDGAVNVVTKNADIKTVEVNAPKASLTVDKNSTVGTVTVTKEADEATVSVAGKVTAVKTEAAKTEIKATDSAKIASVEATKDASAPVISVDKNAKIDKVTTSAPKTEVKGEGTVTKVEAKDGADNSKVTTPGTTVSADKNTEGVIAGSGSGAVEVKPGGSAESGGSKPSTGGGGGGGGGGGTDYVALAKEALHKAVEAAVEPTNVILKGIAVLSLSGNTATIDIEAGETTAWTVFEKDFLAPLFEYNEVYKVKVGDQPEITIDRTSEENKTASTKKIMIAVASDAGLDNPSSQTPISDLHGKDISIIMYGKTASNVEYSDTYTAKFVDLHMKLDAAIKAAVVPTNESLGGIAELTLSLEDHEVTVDIKQPTAAAIDVFNKGFLVKFFAYGEITSVTISDENDGNATTVGDIVTGDKATYQKIMAAVAVAAGINDVNGFTEISILEGKTVKVVMNGTSAGGATYRDTFTVNFITAQD